MAKSPSFQIPDYTSDQKINALLQRSGSPLHDFPFTDALSYDSQYEVDSPGVYTAGLFRTSRGPNRTQLSSLNELGGQQGGVYIYVNNLIRTAYTEGTIFFYDLSGNISSVIQQPSSGLLSLSSDNVDVIATTQITLSAPVIEITGILVVDQGAAFDHIGITDGVTEPVTVAGLAQIYVDSADGDLKVKFGDGTVKTIVTD